MRRIITHLVAVFISCTCLAQFSDPVSFAVKQKRTSANIITLEFHGSIDPGWHVYSTEKTNGGPTCASFRIDNAKGVKTSGALRAVGKVQRKFDEIFGMEVSYFENSCTFEQDIVITEKQYSLSGYLEYGACSDRNCLPPTSVDVSVSGQDGPDGIAVGESAEVQAKGAERPEIYSDSSLVDTFATSTVRICSDADNDLWSDVSAQLKQLNGDTQKTSENDTSLLWLFAMGLMGGIVALFTPCVWPIIPMTVSFFLKRSEKKSRGVKDAIIYGLSIILIYVTLGVLITVAFGANALNALSTNAFVNVFFFLMLVVFGVSFLGFFEITLPSSWSNKTDEKARSSSGLISIFIMAFTLALVSFSCTGPIIGFMLVEVASIGNILGPCIGMLGFAIALALPFTLFALFPTLLKKAPKSGSWMNTVKVVLGFVEIAFALKFLSVADLAYGWGVLDRDVFLIIWTLLAAILALYLFGVIKLPIDGKKKGKRSVAKTMMGLACSLAVIYMIPGICGKPLPAISAFTPPMYTQHIRLFKYENVEAAFKDYDEGMKYARQHKMPVLIDFTGYGCVNCREMEQKVWNDPQVAQILKEKIVLISLYVDDRTPLTRKLTVTENNKTTTLRTVGDKWSYLQRKRFGANAQPFYVLCSPEGGPMQPSYGFDTDPQHFVTFLKKAL
jgi:thiol:disulfide interchange protein